MSDEAAATTVRRTTADSPDARVEAGLAPRQVDAGVHSLLSLSIAAASAQPIPIAHRQAQDGANGFAPSSFTGPSSLANGAPRSGSVGVGSAGKPHSALKHRRLSTSSQARRRLSDAREAATRPSCVRVCGS